MSPALELTSVPAWAVTPTTPDADISGRYWTIVAFGSSGGDIARMWCTQIAAAGYESAIRLHEVPAIEGDDQARAALIADLADARVGWRLMMAGPAHACLRLRALAVQLDVADDEMTVASTEVDSRAVHCVHCRTVTCEPVQIDDVLPCSGCGRNLLVYYHVSRRQGVHLGFMVDAEESAVEESLP